MLYSLEDQTVTFIRTTMEIIMGKILTSILLTVLILSIVSNLALLCLIELRLIEYEYYMSHFLLLSCVVLCGW